MSVLLPPTNLEKWIAENAAAFHPPICNKLLHRGRLSIMLVGGPNQRKDFHSEEGSEFFYQLKGDMEVVTVQNGVQTPVRIMQGMAYLLPSRVRHSPRRPENSIGLVIEREREPGELDSMCWFVDDHSSKVLWEKYFVCRDLGKDLVPVVEEFKQSTEFRTGVPTKEPLGLHIPLVRSVPDPTPFYMSSVPASRGGTDRRLFGNNHPDGEFEIVTQSWGKREISGTDEVFIWQMRDSATISNGQNSFVLGEGECCVIRLDGTFPKITVEREVPSWGLLVYIKDVKGNKREGSSSSRL